MALAIPKRNIWIPVSQFVLPADPFEVAGISGGAASVKPCTERVIFCGAYSCAQQPWICRHRNWKKKKFSLIGGIFFLRMRTGMNNE